MHRFREQAPYCRGFPGMTDDEVMGLTYKVNA